MLNHLLTLCNDGGFYEQVDGGNFKFSFPLKLRFDCNNICSNLTINLTNDVGAKFYFNNL